MIRKKYFILTAILLVGVLLLSGCLGGSDDTEKVINNTEAEITLQSMLNEMGNQNNDKAKDYFADDFSFKFYEEYEWQEENADYFVSPSDESFTSEITKFSKINDNRYLAFLTLKHPEGNSYAKFEVEFKKSNDNLLISEVKEVLPQEEIDFLNNLAKTFDSHDTLDQFLTYFGESPEIKVFGENISNPTPKELYNNFIASQEINNAEFIFDGHQIESPKKVSIYGDLNLSHSNGTSTVNYIDVEIEYNNGLKITNLEIY